MTALLKPLVSSHVLLWCKNKFIKFSPYLAPALAQIWNSWTWTWYIPSSHYIQHMQSNLECPGACHGMKFSNMETHWWYFVQSNFTDNYNHYIDDSSLDLVSVNSECKSAEFRNSAVALIHWSVATSKLMHKRVGDWTQCLAQMSLTQRLWLTQWPTCKFWGVNFRH